MVDLVYPPCLYCICCGNIVDESRPYSLCDHCRERIKWRIDPPRDIKGIKAITCTEYGIYERKIIFRLKYNKQKFIGNFIGEILSDRLEYSDFNFDIIIPVPLHEKRLKARGFNQGGLMAKALGKKIGQKVISHGLLRIKDTKPMRGLGPYEREDNIKDAFKVNVKFKEDITGKRVLLVDDFHTTGSTVLSCAEELRNAGVKEIYFISFAAKNI